MGKRLILVAVCLTVSNFMYQYLTGNALWGGAIEQSFHQSVALVVVYISEKMAPRS